MHLMTQLTLCHRKHLEKLEFHQAILENRLPLSIGGGIGQSRLCMLLLRKAHIGEVQSCIWPKEISEFCNKNNVP